MTLPQPQKTTLRHKILLFGFSLILTLVFLEGVLRIGGWLFFSRQERANKISIGNSGEYRILCLGESTTALGGQNSYPRQLEEILNSQQKRIHFSVINKGIPSGTSTQVLSHLPQFLTQYQPQIAVTMLGINDGPNFPLAKDQAYKTWDRILMHCQVYKLFKLLVIHIQEKILEFRVRGSDAKLAGIEKRIDQHPNTHDYTQLAAIYRVAHKYNEEKVALIKAIKVFPANFEALAYLGLLYKREGEFDKGCEVLEKSIQLNPKNDDLKIQAYTLLGECYTLKGQYDLARQTYLEAMQKNPQVIWELGALGNVAMLEGKFEEAANFFQKQLTLDPTMVEYYEKLSHCYIQLGRLNAAQRLLQIGIEKNPTAAVLYAEQGACLLDLNQYAQAEAVLKKTLTLAHDDFEGKDININELLVKAYQGQGKNKEAQKLQKQNNFFQHSGHAVTAKNYHEIRQLLDKKNIQLIAMQYPLRDITVLKQILTPPGKTVFVDNRQIFQDALTRDGYTKLFTDRFAGDFGHCTPYGNRILAQHLADTILKELFPETSQN